MKSKCALAILAILGVAPAAARAEIFAFPSAGSTVVGSVGFVDGTQVGYFWDAGRGDSVEENFASVLPSATALDLHLHVLETYLNSGAAVDWDVLLNGVNIGSFSIPEGYLGDFNVSYGPFAAIPAILGNYEVRIEVTNVVPDGQGSHSWVYAGALQHSVNIRPEPATLGLLGLASLLIRRRR